MTTRALEKLILSIRKTKEIKEFSLKFKNVSWKYFKIIEKFQQETCMKITKRQMNNCI